ncbi:unnamed protein product [Lathyrus sativus]|nr:unnamed protein product [Lathyrus sativus]
MDNSTSKNENREKPVMLFGVNIAAVDDTASNSFNTGDENHNEMELCSFDKQENESDQDRNEYPDSGQSSNSENGKKVKQWTKNEHEAFLTGLKTVGKGKWKDISMNYVKTKTSIQVASHAQKFFLRQRTPETKRQSIFDTMLDYKDWKTPSPSPSRKPSPSKSI